LEYLERAFTGEVFTEIEYTEDPIEGWSEISFYPIRKGNEVIGTACQAHDITEIKKTERQLRKSEAFNNGVLNALSSHIAVVDSSGYIIAVNESWQRFALENGITNLQRTNVGSNYYDVCEKSAKAGIKSSSDALEGMKDVMAEQKAVFYMEYPCDSPNIHRWFGMRVLKFNSDEPMIVVAHMDISERKLAEENLINKNTELEKTNVELDRFVYSASHDLRSPLTSILGLVYFIEIESKAPEIVGYANMIRSSINRLDAFIKNIISYSRNNRAELEIIQIPLIETLNGIVVALHNMEDAKGIKIEVDIDEQYPFYSDLFRFTTIMENLISNAIKFHGHDVSSYVKITGKSEKDYLYLRIEDNGIGIPSEHLHKVFDMFFRIWGQIAGSGIGLYIVKEAVEKLQGFIEVVSEEGKGTSFIVTLKNQIS
jgi:signal transduction histidine kinase